jgi:hypothetical protein
MKLVQHVFGTRDDNWDAQRFFLQMCDRLWEGSWMRGQLQPAGLKKTAD